MYTVAGLPHDDWLKTCEGARFKTGDPVECCEGKKGFVMWCRAGRSGTTYGSGTMYAVLEMGGGVRVWLDVAGNMRHLKDSTATSRG